MKSLLCALCAMVGITSAPSPARAVMCGNEWRDVVIFTTSWCPQCRYVKQFLQSNSTPYAECDIEADQECANFLWEFTHQGGVPVTFVCREYVIGADIGSIQALLNRYGEYWEGE